VQLASCSASNWRKLCMMAPAHALTCEPAQAVCVSARTTAQRKDHVQHSASASLLIGQGRTAIAAARRPRRARP